MSSRCSAVERCKYSPTGSFLASHVSFSFSLRNRCTCIIQQQFSHVDYLVFVAIHPPLMYCCLSCCFDFRSISFALTTFGGGFRVSSERGLCSRSPRRWYLLAHGLRRRVVVCCHFPQQKGDGGIRTLIQCHLLIMLRRGYARLLLRAAVSLSLPPYPFFAVYGINSKVSSQIG